MQEVDTYAYGQVLRHTAEQDERLTAVIIVAILAGLVGLVVLCRARLQMTERRLGVIRSLADQGQLGRDDLNRLLNPPSRLLKFALVAAWFGLMGGGCMMVAALMQGWPDAPSEFAEPSLGLLGVSLATLSAPLVLREYRRQGVT